MSAYRQRVFIWSGDRATGTFNSYTINLRVPIARAIGAEWVSCSIPGYLLYVQQLPTQSLTTKGQPYWRFVDGLSNQRYTDFKDEPFQPVQITTLQVTWYNPDGTAATLTADHALELEFLCAQPQ